MSRKFKIIIAALVAVVALSIGVGGVAFASDPDATAEQLGAMAQHNSVDTVADLIGLSPEEIMTLFVNRIDELGTAKSAIRNYNNVLLYGIRGVGKTFLVRLLTKHLSEEFPEILPVYVFKPLKKPKRGHSNAAVSQG